VFFAVCASSRFCASVTRMRIPLVLRCFFGVILRLCLYSARPALSTA
jgi:hypothetical protein